MLAAPFIVLAQMDFEIAALKQRQSQIDLAQKSLSPEHFQEFMTRLSESEKEREAERTAERRHQEHCAAIRSTSFWRF